MESWDVDRGTRFVFCSCVCGVRKSVSIYDLKRGVIKSCGCWNREVSRINGKRPKKINNLTGRRFGRLIVRERVGSNKHGFAMWNCLCDCGVVKLISGNHLSTGNTASCGCAYQERAAVRPANRRAWSNNYVKMRCKTDLKYALNRRMQQLIHATLRARNGRKSDRWEVLVGYSINELRERLSETMPLGYSWRSFLDGALHVDQIIPLSVFNFQTDQDLDFKRAWRLDNLQLLPETDNLSKAGKIFSSFQPSLAF